MATAKAITNGYFPFGAVMLGERMAEVFEDPQVQARGILEDLKTGGQHNDIDRLFGPIIGPNPMFRDLRDPPGHNRNRQATAW